ncbi:MAG: YggS family pyridoxal phosphate-dependent enzyme [Anaeroplasmataceae bacterium]|nr:YggS family pyridoxal phosphate-dependent enzyme [Anaeroplasmataceae bacterium]
MKVAENLAEILNTIPQGVQIVAATKYAEAKDMRSLYYAGIHDFGENRVDAFLLKQEELKDLSIHWHFIGHLQTNKAKQVLSKIHVLHSLDSLKLAQIIEKECEVPLDCYVEVNINSEESKHGILPKDCESFLRSLQQYSKVHIIGLMCMTIKESSKDEKKNQFLKLRKLMLEMNERLGYNMECLSMGMSEDYKEAIAAGATTVRLGRILWEATN